MIPSRVRITPPATSAAASSRPAQRRPRPPEPSVGNRGHQPGQQRDAGRHRAGAHEHTLVRARAQRHHQQGGAGHHGDRDGDERGAPAGSAGSGGGGLRNRSIDAGQRRHDPGGDAERGLADVKGLEQRAARGRGCAHREPADRPAGGGHADDFPRRPPGARDPERGPGRVERQHQHGGPQPARRPVVAGPGRPSRRLDDRDRSQQPGKRVLLVVHAGLAVEEPGALHPLRPGGVRGVLGVGLRLDRQPGDAGGAFGERLPQVGQPGLRLGGQPPPREGLADHAVAAAAGRVAAPHQLAPRPETLGDPPRLDAEQPGLPARVVRPRPRSARRRARGTPRSRPRRRRPSDRESAASDPRPRRATSPGTRRSGPPPRPSPLPGTPCGGGPGPSRPPPCSTWSTRRPPAPRASGRRTRAPRPTARSERAGSARAGAAAPS